MHELELATFEIGSASKASLSQSVRRRMQHASAGRDFRPGAAIDSATRCRDFGSEFRNFGVGGGMLQDDRLPCIHGKVDKLVQFLHLKADQHLSDKVAVCFRLPSDCDCVSAQAQALLWRCAAEGRSVPES